MDRKYRKILLIRCAPHDVNPAVPRTIEAAKAVFNEICVACWNNRGLPLAKREASEDIVIHRFGFMLKRKGIKRLASAAIGVLCYQIWLLYKIYTMRPSVVQCFDIYSMIPALVAKAVLRHKVVYDIRDPLALSFSFSRVLKNIVYSIDWIVMGMSSGIVVPDESRIFYLRRWGRKKPLAVILNTCHDEMNQLKKQPPLNCPPDEQIRISYVGYVTPSRGSQMLLDICRDSSSSVEVWAAGGCSPQSLEQEFLSAPKTRWWGRIPWERSLWLVASSTVTWIVYDPSIPVNCIAAPNKFYESLMLSKPVVVCEGMAQAELVRKNGLGLVIRYGDLDSLRSALERLRNSEELTLMSCRCRKYFMEHMTLDGELAKYRLFYEKILC